MKPEELAHLEFEVFQKDKRFLDQFQNLTLANNEYQNELRDGTDLNRLLNAEEMLKQRLLQVIALLQNEQNSASEAVFRARRNFEENRERFRNEITADQVLVPTI